jgi:hypothetical protein
MYWSLRSSVLLVFMTASCYGYDITSFWYHRASISFMRCVYYLSNVICLLISIVFRLIFCDVMMCRLVDGYKHFRGACNFHLQGNVHPVDGIFWYTILLIYFYTCAHVPLILAKYHASSWYIQSQLTGDVVWLYIHHFLFFFKLVF